MLHGRLLERPRYHRYEEEVRISVILDCMRDCSALSASLPRACNGLTVLGYAQEDGTSTEPFYLDMVIRSFVLRVP